MIIKILQLDTNDSLDISSKGYRGLLLGKFSNIKEDASEAYDKVVEDAETIGNDISNTVSEFKDKMEDAENEISSWMQETGDKAEEMISNAEDKVQDMFGEISDEVSYINDINQEAEVRAEEIEQEANNELIDEVVDKAKSAGYGIVDGIGKFSTSTKEGLNVLGEYLGLDYDRPVSGTNKTQRDLNEEDIQRDIDSSNKLREEAPNKEIFDTTSSRTDTSLNVVSTALVCSIG